MMDNGKALRFPLLDKVVETPALVEAFDEKTNTDVLARFLEGIGPVLARLVRDA